MNREGERVRVRKDLLDIKDQVRKPVERGDKVSEIRHMNSKLDDLADKIEEIRDVLHSDGSSGVKTRKKKEIICFIKDNGRTNASELSDQMDLSRTRCSEYLNEMKREGILTSEKEGRKKFYKLEI